MGLSRFMTGSNAGKICCDHCPSGVGRKRPCPYGYCPSVYLCATCWKNPTIKARNVAYHEEAGCQAKHAECVEREAKHAALLASGQPVRSAAVGMDDGRVKVWFRVQGSADLVAYMAADVYRAFSLLQPVTLADFQAIGPVSF